MKFEVYAKNIKNMKFNGQRFSKFTPKKDIFKKFEKFLFK